MQWTKKKKIIISVIVVVLIAGGIFYFKNKGNGDLSGRTIIVTRGDIVQEVAVTGKTKPANDVSLSFEYPGRIAAVYVSVGTTVFPGKSLASESSDALLSDVKEAQSALALEKITLDQLKIGARSEDIAVSEQKVANAQKAFADAKLTLRNSFGTSYTKADDAIRGKVDQFMSNPRSSTPQLNFAMSDSALKTRIETARIAIEADLNSWQNILTVSLAGELSADAGAKVAVFLANEKQFLDMVALAINGLTATSQLSQTTLDSWRASVYTARTNLDSTATDLAAALQNYNTTESALALASLELTLKKSGATKEAISIQETRIAQSAARLASLESRLSKNTLRSPITGVVTKVNAKVGELASANVPVITIISEGNLEIEANVPEVDIGKVNIGNDVSLSFDSYPKEIFHGTVRAVEPGETVIDGVVNFKVTVIIEQNKNLKPGLTANLHIETGRKAGVLTLPLVAILENDEGTFVEKISGGKTVQVPIVIGARSNDGNVEVLEGVTEGETVLNVGLK